MATNLVALSYFALQGYVLWHIAISMAIANIAGSVLGTRLALRGGSSFVRNIFIVVVSALIVRTLWQALA